MGNQNAGHIKMNDHEQSLSAQNPARLYAEDSHLWMAAIVESSEDAIISKDLNGIIISCNQGASRLFGYTVEELIGKPMTTLIPTEHHNEEVEILSRIRRGERIEHFETIRQRKDGTLISVSLTISPVKDKTGKIIGASKIARNISERKQTEQKLAASFQREKTARELAEKANRAKDDFLASLSHELRTPLNPVLMLSSDQAENADLSPETRKHFEIIHKNIELEARLIDDLLDLTHITYGKIFLNERLVDISTVLREAIATVNSELNEKQIELVLNIQDSRTPVYGDDVRLQQVFWNVMKNAVKFTPPKGKIVVETSLENGKIKISITDSGIGMTSEEMDRIFGAFSQGDHVTDGHRFGGLGLGLTISRRLLELHRGRIHAWSAGRNHGSSFVIELPVAKAEKADVELLQNGQNAPSIPFSGNNHRVLLIEDHEPTRLALTHLLNRRKFRVSAVGSSAEAIKICVREKFDLVISDIGLPDGSGNDLMTKLRDGYGLKGIALTGYGMEHDIERSLAAGFVSHLIKPVSVQALERAVGVFFAAEAHETTDKQFEIIE
jgi:PAS domain S-box-containing protein